MANRGAIDQILSDDNRKYTGREVRERLEAAGFVIVPKEPTDEMKRAAFGPIMHGGRGGPITADLLRQEVALNTYRRIIEAANVL
jgi:hypothetical protein